MQPDDADEHENRAGHGVQHEFDGGVDAPLVSPDADQEIHGDQHDFPEQEEEKEVKREKHADDADFEHQQHDEEFFDAVVDAVPGGQHGDGSKERGEDDQEQVDAVESEVIVDRRDVDPFGEFLELITGNADLHLGDQQQGEKEFNGGDGQCEAANPQVIVGAQEQQRKPGRSGKEDDDRKQIAAVHQRTAPTVEGRKYGQKMIAIITSAPITTQTA